MRIDLRNDPAKFYPDPIWNDGALGFFKRVAQKQKEEEENNNSNRMSTIRDKFLI